VGLAHRSASSRYYRWIKAAIWQRVFADLQAQADQEGELDLCSSLVIATKAWCLKR
jgi:hypothetical protein